MEKLNIISQYIFKFKSSNDLLEDSLSKTKNLEWVNNNNNLISKNHLLNRDGNFELLHKWFHECISQVTEEMQYPCSDIKITQSWANKSDSKMWHHPHTHPNSLISGIYYLTTSEACTWFSVKNIWNFTEDSLFQIPCKEEEWNIIFKQPSEAGNLILFPSSLYHSVDDTHKNTRYTISFNTFPSGIVGNFYNSTGMKIEVM